MKKTKGYVLIENIYFVYAMRFMKWHCLIQKKKLSRPMNNHSPIGIMKLELSLR